MTAAIGPPDSTTIPATVSGPMYLISSLRPAGTIEPSPPSGSPAAASESCEASTDKSLGANPAANRFDTARWKWARSGKEATASRMTGKDAALSTMPILFIMLSCSACYRQRFAPVRHPRTPPTPTADEPTFPPRYRCHRGVPVAGDGPISRDQKGQSGPPVVFPDGRFFRAVL